MAKNNSELQGIRKKLVAAIAMVLVACIMVVSSSYAWFTLSTAPEVKGIQTSVGSNGNLEIALREGDLDAITALAQGGGTFPMANTYWGNLIDLSDSSYGMSNIALAPGRLNLTDNSTKYYKDFTVNNVANQDVYKVGGTYVDGSATYTIETVSYVAEDGTDPVTYTATIHAYVSDHKYSLPTTGLGHLKVATYAADGRVSMLDSSSVETGFYNPETNTFQRANGYGVRAIGVVSGLSDAELALRNAKNTVNSTISSVTTAAKNSIRNDGSKLANIAIQQYTADAPSFTADDYNNIVTALNNLDKIEQSIKSALDQAVIAIGVQQGKTITAVSWDGNDIVAVNGEDVVTIAWGSLPNANTYPSLKKAYTAHGELKTDLATARTALPTGGAPYDFDQLSPALEPLINVSGLTISVGNNTPQPVADFKDVAMDYVDEVLDGASINVFMNEGIYSDIAKFVGNFAETAEVAIDGGILTSSMADRTFNLPILLQTNTAMPTPPEGGMAHLVFTADWLGGLQAVTDPNAGTSKSLSDIYGYIVDFAFRTNAANSNLLLQTSGTSRVGNNDAEQVQGSGSYMEFTLGADDYTMAQMVKLMGAVRVVFINDLAEVVAIAALDLDKDPVGEAGKANEIADATTYDYIDSDNTAWKLKTAAVTGETIRASLHLYDFSLNADGSLNLGDKIPASAAVITDLVQNTPTGISAMVYLDGDKVENADVAISGKSMTGTMNLQFASSADLVPMQYTFQEENKLAKPSINLSGNELTITAVDGATEYEFYVGGVATGVTTTTTGTAIDLSTALAGETAGLEGASIAITVVAKGTDKTNSDQSNIVNWKVPTP